MLEPGSKAPSFELKSLEGATESLAGILKQGPAVFVFFKTSCPTCQFTMPYVQRLSSGAMRVFGISQDDAAATQRFMKQFGLQLPVLLDTSKDRYPASNGFKIDHVPSFFALAAGGTVEKSFTGFIKAALEELGTQAGVTVFRAGELVPAIKPG